MTARMSDEEFEDWCTNVNDDAGNVSLPLIAEARRARESEAAALDALREIEALAHETINDGETHTVGFLKGDLLVRVRAIAKAGRR